MSENHHYFSRHVLAGSRTIIQYGYHRKRYYKPILMPRGMNNNGSGESFFLT